MCRIFTNGTGTRVPLDVSQYIIVRNNVRNDEELLFNFSVAGVVPGLTYKYDRVSVIRILYRSFVPVPFSKYELFSQILFYRDYGI